MSWYSNHSPFGFSDISVHFIDIKIIWRLSLILRHQHVKVRLVNFIKLSQMRSHVMYIFSFDLILRCREFELKCDTFSWVIWWKSTKCAYKIAFTIWMQKVYGSILDRIRCVFRYLCHPLVRSQKQIYL